MTCCREWLQRENHNHPVGFEAASEEYVMNDCSKIRAGEWVQVKSKNQILKTLDNSGQLERMPFMPEMFQYCGQRFRVFKRAHKTCDPPNGLEGRRVTNALHLADVRCDGQAHGGCQAGCLIFWKDAWLERVNDVVGPPPIFEIAKSQPNAKQCDTVIGCTEQEVWAGTLASGNETNPAEVMYVCQSTNLSKATHPLCWWDLRQYIEDYTSGNVRLSQILAAFLFFVYSTIARGGFGVGSAMRWAYDCFQKLRGGVVYPIRVGEIQKGMRTPAAHLNLQIGELVRVKSYKEILATLNEISHNRGMYFDAEAVPFCGGAYEVLRRVEKIVDEKTGRMMNIKNDAIILKGVGCQARYAQCRRFCPRSIYVYWREIWLERVTNEGQHSESKASNSP